MRSRSFGTESRVTAPFFSTGKRHKGWGSGKSSAARSWLFRVPSPESRVPSTNHFAAVTNVDVSTVTPRPIVLETDTF